MRLTWPSDYVNKIICGDSLGVMKEMPDESVDMVMTSPPYWGLRDYGTGPDQLGLEPTPELYIEHLTEIFNEAKRVLKKEGVLFLNIGDTYGGSGQGSQTGYGDYKRQRVIGTMDKSISIKLMPKCLLMIPERLAWSLIQSGWILRNKIIWYKPNAMPSSVTDRFNNRHEFIYMFSKNQKYYFDLDAIREKTLSGEGKKYDVSTHKYQQIKHSWMGQNREDFFNHPLGKNPGDVFEINTQPFPEAHFAVFPEKLCEKPIKAGCPEEVCRKCGRARERIVKIDRSDCEIQKWDEMEEGLSRKVKGGIEKDLHKRKNISGIFAYSIGAKRDTIGYTDCGCNTGFEGGIVLDPFCGAGTALYVAKDMKRQYVGIDIKQEYCDMCEERLAQGVL